MNIPLSEAVGQLVSEFRNLKHHTVDAVVAPDGLVRVKLGLAIDNEEGWIVVSPDEQPRHVVEFEFRVHDVDQLHDAASSLDPNIT